MKGWMPGLVKPVVDMIGDSRVRGHEFKSWHFMLNGLFLAFISCKLLLEKTENEAGNGQSKE